MIKVIDLEKSEAKLGSGGMVHKELTPRQFAAFMIGDAVDAMIEHFDDDDMTTKEKQQVVDEMWNLRNRMTKRFPTLGKS
jgi:hypothetical protein